MAMGLKKAHLLMERLQVNEQKLNEIYKECMDGKEKSAYELLIMYSKTRRLVDEYMSILGYLSNGAEKSAKSFERLDFLKHTIIASLISLPILFFAFQNKIDSSVRMSLVNMDLLGIASMLGIFSTKSIKKGKLADYLGSEETLKVIDNVSHLCSDCNHELTDMLNKTENIDDEEEDNDLNSLANRAILKALLDNDILEMMLLPTDVVEEIIYQLQQDLDTDEPDIIKLFVMAKKRVIESYTNREDLQLKRRKK